MADAPEALILDLVEWLAAGPRAYADVMDAWRTSCPGLPVWEDAVDRGLVARAFDDQLGAVVRVTPRGLDLLAKENRLGRATP